MQQRINYLFAQDISMWYLYWPFAWVRINCSIAVCDFFNLTKVAAECGRSFFSIVNRKQTTNNRCHIATVFNDLMDVDFCNAANDADRDRKFRLGIWDNI